MTEGDSMLTDMVHALEPDAAHDWQPVLHLLGDPAVTTGRQHRAVPDGSKRLLAYVALHRRPVERLCAAGVLWPRHSDSRAPGNVRTALWRLSGIGVPVLTVDKYTLAARDDLVLDIDVVSVWAARLGGRPAPEGLNAVTVGSHRLELLPGWCDEWAISERERPRQVILHAMEAQSRHMARRDRCAEAVQAAMMAVGADPLHESAQRVPIESHLAGGNRTEALRAFATYRTFLHREVGADPGPPSPASSVEEDRSWIPSH
jgi:DNA-binding SARP family transcriptional activator